MSMSKASHRWLTVIVAGPLAGCVDPFPPPDGVGSFVAREDYFLGNNDTPLLVDGPGIFENDSRPRGSDFELAGYQESTTLGASVVVHEDGSVEYVPLPRYLGTDAFVYRLVDADPGSEAATVNILVRPARLGLEDILVAGGGFRIDGPPGEAIGTALASIEDQNGDGVRDIVIGAPQSDATGTDAGSVYFVWGRAESALISIPDDVVTGEQGFTITGPSGTVSGYELGWAVANAGDFNGDGRDDVIMGAPGAPQNAEISAGRGYIWFGGGSPANLQLADDSVDPSANAGAFVVVTETDGLQRLGSSVSGGHDINRDGRHDIIIGAPGAPNLVDIRAGEVIVVFGSATGVLSAANVTSSGHGFVVNGILADETAIGNAVSLLGDVNNDSYDDILIGSHLAGGGMAGWSFLVFGNPNGSDVSLVDIGTLIGFAIASPSQGERLGWSVSGVGDVNGDGREDFVIGAIGGASIVGEEAGRAYLVYGKDGTSTVRTDTMADAAEGVVYLGEVGFDQAGFSVSGLGDVNGDGIDDFAIGAPLFDGVANNAGRVYVLFGGAELPGQVSLAGLELGVDGFVIDGAHSEQRAGSAVAPAGDVNGDGLGDILIGAPGSLFGGGDAGAVYVVFGARTVFAPP